MATGWSPSCCLGDGRGKLRHWAEGDASQSASQRGRGGARVNTLKSSSWDRWGVGGVTQPPLPPPPSLNSQTGKTNVTESRCDLSVTICKSVFFALPTVNECEWDKRQTQATIVWDHVGTVNLILHEPDRIMTLWELQWEVFMVTLFRQVTLHEWVNNSYNAATAYEQRLQYEP